MEPMTVLVPSDDHDGALIPVCVVKRLGALVGVRAAGSAVICFLPPDMIRVA